MANKIEILETFENSQSIRDEHWLNSTRYDLFTTHRSSCSYCFKRLRGMELPKLKIIVRPQDRDGFEEREILDEHDPRVK